MDKKISTIRSRLQLAAQQANRHEFASHSAREREMDEGDGQEVHGGAYDGGIDSDEGYGEYQDQRRGQDKVMDWAEKLGLKHEEELRLAYLYAMRTVKTTTTDVLEVEGAKLKGILDRALAAKQREFKTGTRETGASRRPKPPPPPKSETIGMVKLGSLFPVDYHKKSVRPPSGMRRPPGRAHTKDFIFFLIMSYLDVRDIVATGACCAGLNRYILSDGDFQQVWRRLGWEIFGRSSVYNMSQFVRLWNNYKYCTCFAYGQIELLDKILRSDVVGRYQILLVDKFVPSRADVSVAKAIFCTAKALSPCIVYIQDEAILQDSVKSRLNKARNKLLQKSDFVQGRSPRLLLKKLDIDRCLEGGEDPEEDEADEEQAERDDRVERHHQERRLTRNQVLELIDLVQKDLSSDTIVVICKSRSPWDVRDDLVRCFGQLVHVKPHRGPQKNGGKSGHISQFEKLPLSLSNDEYETLSERLNCMNSDQFQQVLHRATSSMTNRLRSATHFKIMNGKYQVTTAEDQDAQEMSFYDLPVDMISYGPYVFSDFPVLEIGNEPKLLHGGNCSYIPSKRIIQWEQTIKEKNI